MKSNKKINTVKLLDVVSIGGKNVKEFDNELMYLSTGDLEESNIVNLEPVTFDSRPSRANQLVEINDILFAKMKDTRKTLLINENTKNIIVSTGFYVLRTSNKVLPKYIYHYLNSDYFLNQKNKLCKGATQKAINNDGLKQIDIVLYDDKIQDKIVELLDKSQQLIDKRKEQIEALDELVKSQFIEMFGDLSKNDKGWVEVELSEACDVIHRYPTFYGMEYIEKGTPVIRIGNIKMDGILDDNMENYIFVYDNVNNDFPLTSVELGDILMAVRGDGSAAKRIGIVKTPKLIGANISPNLLRIKAKDSVVNNIYLFRYLISEVGQRRLDAYVNKTAKKNIAAKDIKKVITPIPPIELQNKFADFVKQVDKLKFEMEKSLKELEDNFNSLMQKAFKG